MPDNALNVLGTRIREARKERGLTQERLAEQVGLSTRHIAKVEKGDVNPSLEVLSTLVKTLGISIDSVFNSDSAEMTEEIQEIASLYRACSEQEQRLILAAVRAMAKELNQD